MISIPNIKDKMPISYLEFFISHLNYINVKTYTVKNYALNAQEHCILLACNRELVLTIAVKLRSNQVH